MTRRKIGWLTLICFGIILFWMPVNSFAKDKPPAPTKGTPAENANFGTTDKTNKYGLLSTQYLRSWGSYINNPSGNKISLRGVTETYSTANFVGVKLYLQVWNSAKNKWVDAKYVGSFENSNSTYVSQLFTYNNVSSGYYYRTKAIHYVIQNGNTERVQSVSQYIYLD